VDSPGAVDGQYAVTRVMRQEPLPRKVMQLHRPRPRGSSPLDMIRDIQLSHRIVAVPPGLYEELKISGLLE
jgi:hypothetical protein